MVDRALSAGSAISSIIQRVGEITQLLDQARGGDSESRERFFSRMYAELDGLARHHLDRPERVTVLDAPALVHEVYQRRAQQGELPGQDRTAFLGYASRIMRSVVIDYVRSRNAQRHSGDVQIVTLKTGIAGRLAPEPDLLALGAAMESLARIDERAHWVVEMRYFGGMEVEEIAQFLGISRATVKRDWQRARAFLLETMSPEHDRA
jgi:RNA polymerase sigma factor (TIGR02999 family)